MSNKNTSLDTYINILYDFFYGNRDTGCYQNKKIIKNEITLENIKMGKDFDSTDIFAGKFNYIGNWNNKWHFERLSSTSYPSCVSIGVYDNKNSNVDDMNRKELINMKMMYIGSEINIMSSNRLILLPIINFDIKLGELRKYNSVLSEKITGVDDTKLFINVTEYYNKIETLENYLKSKKEKIDTHEWKIIIMEVLYALYLLNIELPNFRHNKLDLQSVKIQRLKDIKKDKIIKIDDDEIKIPGTKYEIKISDFENSTSNNYLNDKLMKKSENPYYDIHYFIQSIIYFIDENNYVNSELNKFVEEIIPEKFKYKNSTNFTGLDEAYFDSVSGNILTPAMILKKNNFFAEFINHNKMDMSVSPMANDEEKISSMTETSSNAPRMLGKKINYKKNITETNINRPVMIKGLRKIRNERVQPHNKKSNSVIDSDDILKVAENKHNKRLESTPVFKNNENNDRFDVDPDTDMDYEDMSTDKTEVPQSVGGDLLTKVLKAREHKRIEKSESSVSNKESSVTPKKDKSESSITPKQKSESSSKKDKSESSITPTKKISESSVKKSDKKDKISETSLSLSDDEDDLIASKPSMNAYGASNIPVVSENTRNSLLKDLPDNYTGELPDSLRSRVPSMMQYNNTFKAFDGMNPLQPNINSNMMSTIGSAGIGMNGMTPPMMPPNLPISNLDKNLFNNASAGLGGMPGLDQFAAPQGMPMMPQGMSMMPQGMPMMPQGMPSMMPPQGMHPMMPQGMPQGIPSMMGQMGGTKPEPKKYKLKKTPENGDFFF